MERFNQILNTYIALIEIPLGWFVGPGGISGGARLTYDLVATFFVACAVYSIYRVLKNTLRYVFKRDRLVDRAEIDRVMSGEDSHGASIQATKNLKATVEPLKKARDYGRLGEVYASVNNYKEAAKWYKKAKQYSKAADAYAKAGQTVRAAKLLTKAGEFEAAGDLYADKGKYIRAAKAYERAGKKPKAAEAYGAAGKVKEAVNQFSEYFESARDSADVQIEAAERCFKLLKESKGVKDADEETLRTLYSAVAQRFEHAKRYADAAALYQLVGDLVRAAEVYVLDGKLEQAAQCYKAAGRQKDAARVSGRFYELKGRHKEAGLAYQSAEEYLRAAECFARVKETVRAAECFEKGGAHFRAGLAYAHAARFEDAIRMLQQVKESAAEFDQSRGLLGRCFYQLHDYAHCAATLDNHLTGKRVESANAEYFYMLALAYEQLGKLDESRELLYKLRTVNVDFKDVNERISNISSRISMRDSGMIESGAPKGGDGSDEPVAKHKMQAVNNSIGKRYLLEREIGRGGMGEVYLAKDVELDRMVAIKFLGSLVDNSEEYRQRFVREAKAAARINHPNIVSIYDINATAGKAFLAMEFIEGTDLHTYVKNKGKLTQREAVNIIGQACMALAAIHEAGIVHRDIKPDNILISKGGLVKLTDFGLAKAEDNRMTQAGTVLGTPSYMSPEQVLGEDVGPVSDIYSMGLVFHEALTGKTYFDDGNVLKRQLEETPPKPSEMAEGVSEAVDRIVMKCIAKEAKERYPTAKELVQDLRAVTGNQAQQAGA